MVLRGNRIHQMGCTGRDRRRPPGWYPYEHHHGILYGHGKGPVLSIIRQSGTGHATNVIGGWRWACNPPSAHPRAGRRIWGSFECAGLYGVAIAAAV